MKELYQPLIIFSVESKQLSEGLNGAHTRYAENVLRDSGARFERVFGVYDNISEVSFIVTSPEHFAIAIGLAKEFNQESVLLRDNENNATLQFLGGNKPKFMGIGKMTAVDVDEALAVNAYTYSPRLKQYFVCK